MTATRALGLAIGLLAVAVSAQPPPGRGPGPGPGPSGPGGRGRQDPERAADRDLFHFLLDHRDRIERRVTEIPGGVETLTETDDPEVRSKLREHVRRMKARVEEGRPIRMRDPLFAEIFRHADRIAMRIEETDRGLRVTETSDDPWVTRLIREHARVVDGFVARGHEEARRNHPLPARPPQP